LTNPIGKRAKGKIGSSNFNSKTDAQLKCLELFPFLGAMSAAAARPGIMSRMMMICAVFGSVVLLLGMWVLTPKVMPFSGGSAMQPKTPQTHVIKAFSGDSKVPASVEAGLEAGLEDSRDPQSSKQDSFGSRLEGSDSVGTRKTCLGLKFVQGHKKCRLSLYLTALQSEALLRVRERPNYKPCEWHTKHGKWNEFCTCEGNLTVAGQAAKLCMVPVYGKVVTLYEPRGGFMGTTLGYEFGERNEYQHALTKRLPPQGVVVDIGANIGLVSMLFAMLNPGVRVYSFEANPRTFKFTSQNIKANHLDTQVTVRNLALSSTDGELIKLFECESANIGKSSLYARPAEGERGDCATSMVPTITFPTILQTFGLTRIDMLKLDCEGCERTVLPHITPGIVTDACGECHLNPSSEPGLAQMCNNLLHRSLDHS